MSGFELIPCGKAAERRELIAAIVEVSVDRRDQVSYIKPIENPSAAYGTFCNRISVRLWPGMLNPRDKLRSMNVSVSHDRLEESMESKVRWFRSLSFNERMELLCIFTDLALSIQPDLPNRRHVESASKRIRVITEKRR